jgi:acetyl-CoA synthetase
MNYRITTEDEYHGAVEEARNSPEKFWSDIAAHFIWKKKWDEVLRHDFQKPDVRWFGGAQLNITENLIDRHVATQPNAIAVIWEPNDPTHSAKKISWSELQNEVNRLANGLRNMGVKKGDRICIYMPMVPELLFSMLASARIGAIHSVVFGGFSSVSLRERINDCGAAWVITADEIRRGEKNIGAKSVVDEALEGTACVKCVIVAKVSGSNTNMLQGRDVWMHDLCAGMPDACEPEIMNSEDPLFILYTSGSTGKPKGVVHTCGGYMVYAAWSFANVFQCSAGDLFWCTADAGWITGHSYFAYGPLLNGTPVVMFEGIPTWPDAGRFWQVIEKHRITHFYTAPTAIRSLMTSDLSFVSSCDLSSLKMLGSVGEPINEEAWHWYHQHVGGGRCPVVDTWWQTETGGIMISGLGNLLPLKPAHAGQPLPGIQPALLDTEGNEIDGNEKEGLLVIKFPWPSIIRTTWGDHERCRLNYFSHYNGYYFTGDAARRDESGLYRIIGRVDDVVNVSGHRIGTAEVENAINEHPAVVESAVVGFPHDIKGQAIFAFVICTSTPENPNQLNHEIADVVSKQIGKFARPDKVLVVSGLPKTRSGKIMRRILRKIAEGDYSNFGDTSTLLDPGVVAQIVNDAEQL